MNRNSWMWRSTAMLVIWIASSNGQHTDALCDSSYSWSYNSLGQTPCLVAAILSTPCSSTGDFHIGALASGSPGYDPPTKPTECQCNTVHYSLLGACAACQGATTSGIPWTRFKENCTSTWPDGQFLFDIPPDTAVPGWAYQLVEGANRFNVTEALASKDEPEHTGARPSSSSTNAAATTPTPTPTPSSTTLSSNASSGSTGTIAGAVVGGVAGVAILGGLIAFFISRRRKSSKRYNEIPVNLEDAFNEKDSHYHRKEGSEVSIPSLSAASTLPYYNPNDSSTFPPPKEGAPIRHFSEDSYTLVGSNPPLGTLGWDQHSPRAEV